MTEWNLDGWIITQLDFNRMIIDGVNTGALTIELSGYPQPDAVLPNLWAMEEPIKFKMEHHQAIYEFIGNIAQCTISPLQWVQFQIENVSDMARTAIE